MEVMAGVVSCLTLSVTLNKISERLLTEELNKEDLSTNSKSDPVANICCVKTLLLQ